MGTYADATSLQYLEYDYDNVGNIDWIKDWKVGNPQTLSFAYDALNRLTAAQATGGTNGNGDYAQESYSYDASTGNLATKSTLGSYTYSTYHPHAVASITNGWSFQYDPNGNQTQRVTGSTFNLSYNAESKMVEVSGAATDSFVYDGDGNRVKSIVGSTTTVFIGNYYEWESSATRKHYYAGTNRIALRDGEALYFLFGDHLGSTSLSYRVSDGYVARHLYKPWGEKRYPPGASELPTKYRFTGQYVQNELWLYFYNARWYDNRVGRFIQADTVVPDPKKTQSFDRFEYSFNNPIKYFDPSGHGACDDPTNTDPACYPTIWIYNLTQEELESYEVAQETNYDCGDTSILMLYNIQFHKNPKNKQLPINLFWNPYRFPGFGITPNNQANVLTDILTSENANYVAKYSQGATTNDLIANINKDYLTIVTVSWGDNLSNPGHALLLAGYAPSSGEFYFLDPSGGVLRVSGKTSFENTYKPFTFEQAWLEQPNIFIPSGSMVYVIPIYW
jgi:RHS repeat-associated protein